MNNQFKYIKFYYQCTDCGTRYDDSEIRYLCPDCESLNTPDLPPRGILKTHYNYDKLLGCFNDIKQNGFLELLPIHNSDSLPNLRIGDTPFYKINNIDGTNYPFNLYLKDDSRNPTYSFKDRASSVVSAFAKEKGIDTIIAASTGNAGSSIAGMCAAQNQKAIVLVPENAPHAKLAQMVMYGARVIPVKGTYDDAFTLSIRATKALGYYNRNTAYNPLTIEGKKTVGFEIFEQLNFKVPDRIFVPVGDGVIISGIYKGFEDLIKLQLIDKMPVVVAVQSEGSDNLIRNIFVDQFILKKSNTIADSISVDFPSNYYMTKQYIEKYNGEMVSVSDKKILEASKNLAENTGLFAEPASAAAFAGFISYNERELLPDHSNNIVLLTGSGLKDLKGIEETLKVPESIYPDLDEFKKAIQ